MLIFARLTITLLLITAATSHALATRWHHFLVISDIHFNPFAACKNSSHHCPLAQQLMTNPYNNWPAIFNHDGTHTLRYRRDSNYYLLHLLLQYLKLKHPHPDFILIPGDFLAHHFVANYKKYTGDISLKHYHHFVDKTFALLSKQLKQTFPNTPIYPALGNNDAYGGDYYAGSAFYQSLARHDKWLSFFINIKNKMAFEQSFPQGGYYEVRSGNQMKNRIIVLNTVLFSKQARGTNVSQLALAELNWLAHRLALAQKNNQHVYLVYHIPYGIDVFTTIKFHLLKTITFWRNSYQQRFLSLLDKYHLVIKAIITGHLHMDGFSLYRNHHNVIIDTFTPALSPLFGNNPAFKDYTYNVATGDLTNFTTYYLNLTRKPLQWRKEYNFNHLYQPNCSHCKLKAAMAAFKKSGKLSPYYQKYYAVSTDHQPITQGYWLYYWCAMQHQTTKAYYHCVIPKLTGLNKMRVIIVSYLNF